VFREKLRAGVVVAVATEVVNSGLRVPALKLVTVPLETVIETLLPTTENVAVALLTKLAGAGTATPFTSIVALMEPNAVSIRYKSSATMGSMPLRLRPRFAVIGFELCK
jgi:ABC-type lipopolysaccharide export system ATPase subunit